MKMLCRKCLTVMGTIPAPVSFYCQNPKCERYSDLTLAGVAQPHPEEKPSG